jgi:hypothetical protein
VDEESGGAPAFAAVVGWEPGVGRRMDEHLDSTLFIALFSSLVTKSWYLRFTMT